jgi:hypothetical protein
MMVWQYLKINLCLKRYVKMSKNKRPNVLVVGFPKCGSTFLYHLLKQHPDIYIPKIKEINYFNKDNFFLGEPEILNPRYFKSREWYYSFFKTNKKIAIDFSIMSAYDIKSAERVKKELGDIKIIFITRNKKDFEKSLKNFLKKEKMPLEDLERYSKFNYYVKNYKRYFSHIKVINLKDLNKNPEKELGVLMKFLKIKNYNFNLNMPKHETKKYKMSLFQFLKRHVYIAIVKSFYKFISFNVSANLKARGEK